MPNSDRKPAGAQECLQRCPRAPIIRSTRRIRNEDEDHPEPKSLDQLRCRRIALQHTGLPCRYALAAATSPRICGRRPDTYPSKVRQVSDSNDTHVLLLYLCFVKEHEGQHDNYGSALVAQPGRSQGRSVTTAGSQPMMYVRPAHLPCSGLPQSPVRRDCTLRTCNRIKESPRTRRTGYHYVRV